MPSSSLKWYLQRIRRMQPREVVWHSRRASRSVLLSVRPTGSAHPLGDGTGPADWSRALESFRSAAGRPVLLDRNRALKIASEHPQDFARLIAAAESAVDMSFEFFGYPMVTLPNPVNWNYDPISSTDWSLTSSSQFGGWAAEGDVKWIWELNRLQHLPLLAEAWLVTGDARYSTAAFSHLDSWIEQNPPGRGVAWRGAFEAGIRAISIAIALQGLRDSPTLTIHRFQRIVGVLAESATRCWENRSLFSSANNHLVGEMTGLAVVAMLIPELHDAKGWELKAVNELSVQACKQIHADGTGAEQSIAYQIFTIELLNLIGVLLTQRDGTAPEPIISAIARSSSFLSSLVDQREPDPRYGDDDGGFALRLGPQRTRPIREHLGIVSALCGHSLAPEAVHDTVDAQWYREATLTPSEPKRNPSSDISTCKGSFVAAEGGLVVLRARETRVTVDVGPLGYLSIAAHGHADALAVTVSSDGEEIVTDPGTGSYHGHPDWRTVMRGTGAHATVCVDGQDQSVAAGPFLWSRHAHVRVRGINLEAGVVDAQHDGYRRLPGAVIHRRWVIASPRSRTQLFVDLLTGEQTHRCEQTWPLHPGLDVAPLANGHVVKRRGEPFVQFLYAASASLTQQQIRGDVETHRGWWSDRLESRVPAWWLSATCNAALPLAMVALVSPMDGIDTRNLSVRVAGTSIEVEWSEDGRTCRAHIDTEIGAKVSLN